MKCDVAVIGAGFAGLSAAVQLAGAGLNVVVIESAPRLGGRASVFTDPETNERVDNGQHVLFGCYRDTYAFLGRLGTAGLAPLDSRLTIAITAAGGRPHVLSCPPLPPPFHLAAGILMWPAVSLRDRLSALKLWPILRAARRDGAAAVADRVASHLTVSDWLQDRGQTPELCRWLWHPLAIAALNQSPDHAAAVPFVRVLAEMFGPRATDSAIGVPSVPLDELYAEPAAKFVESRGGAVLRRRPASLTADEAGRITLRAGDDEIRAQAIISSVPWHAFSRLWQPAVPAALAPLAAAATSTPALPIVTVNFWLDRPVLPRKFVGLLDGPMHWAFDKGVIFGRDESHLSVVSSGATALVPLDRQEIIDIAREQLRRALPEMARATVRRALVVREQRATFSVAPDAPARPATRTALAGFYLAGDWTDTGLPGTIESAVVSGHRAAEAVMGDRKVLGF